MPTLTWKHLAFEDHGDLMTFQLEYDFPHEVVSSLMDESEITHFRVYDELAYLVLNFPKSIHSKDEQETRPIALVQDDDEHTLYFVSPTSIDLSDFFETLERKNVTNFQDVYASFFIYVMKRFTISLDEMQKYVDLQEEKLLRKPDNARFAKLLHVQKRLTHYKVAISGFQDILMLIRENKPPFFWKESLQSDYTTIRIESSQVKTAIKVIDEQITSILNVTNSIYSNNMSRTMQTLTSITLVLSIPTLVASIYGMNIPLPFQDHPYSLEIVIIITFFMTCFLVYYLYKRDWF